MTTTSHTVNGIDVAALQALAGECAENPPSAQAKFEVATQWRGGTCSESLISGFELGGKKVERQFSFSSDEPNEVGGGNTAPNPQEYLMGALNSCVLVGFVAGCAMKGIELRDLEVRCETELDLRGFLGVAPVDPGCQSIRYTVTIDGNGTMEDYEEISKMVQATSPNYFNLSQPVSLEARVVSA